ncbi:MAG: TRAP transporter substrate-binding protein DctP [Clostridia bacterium]|nr:TRAP transporter substrate-binding protein DctP [Clostridia bacterium]
MAVTVMALVLAAFLTACGGKPASNSGTSSSGGSAAGGSAAGSAAGGAGQTTQPQAQAGTVTLKFADGYPPAHWVVVHFAKPWMERVTQYTQGRVQFEYYPAGQLGKLQDALNLLRSGSIDVGDVQPSLFPGELPLSGVALLPAAFDTGKAGSDAYNALLREGPVLEEFLKQGIRPVAAFVLPPYEIVTARKAVSRLEDVKGLKLRSGGGGHSLAITALGGTPVTLSGPDVYEALQRGTIDGAVWPLSSMKEYGMSEVVKHITVGAGLPGIIITFAVSEKTWQSWPEDVREAVRKASDEAFSEGVAWLDENTRAMAKEMEAKGIQLHPIADQEQTRWRQALLPVWDQWVKDMTAKGLPGAEVRQAFEKALGR